MGTFQKSQMLYDDGEYYKWTAKAAHDNPYYTKGIDHSELNSTEGYEVLYFINHFCDKHINKPINLSTYQYVERLIKEKIPPTLKTHKKVADWIIQYLGQLNY